MIHHARAHGRSRKHYCSVSLHLEINGTDHGYIHTYIHTYRQRGPVGVLAPARPISTLWAWLHVHSNSDRERPVEESGRTRKKSI